MDAGDLGGDFTAASLGPQRSCKPTSFGQARFRNASAKKRLKKDEASKEETQTSSTAIHSVCIPSTKPPSLNASSRSFHRSTVGSESTLLMISALSARCFGVAMVMVDCQEENKVSSSSNASSLSERRKQRGGRAAASQFRAPTRFRLNVDEFCNKGSVYSLPLSQNSCRPPTSISLLPQQTTTTSF